MGLFSKLAKAFDHSESVNVDQEIHKAVFSAEEELLKEAQTILDSVKSDSELGKPKYPKEEEDLLNKLLELGFTKQPQAVELQKKIDQYKEKKALYDQEREAAKQVSKLVQYYQSKYKNKFITIDSIKSICNRFGLLFAPIQMYSAEIPLKNMREIAHFNCDIEDKLLLTTISCDDREFYSLVNEKKASSRYSYETTVKILLPEFKSRWSIPNHALDDYELKEFGARAIKEKYGIKVSSWRINLVSQEKVKTTDLTNAMMIAPKNKFTIPEDYIVENGFEVGYRKVVEIKDPVVLQPVKGGYLIVSAWGFEETLPEISGSPKNQISDNLN